MKVRVVDAVGTMHDIEHDACPDFDIVARWTGNRFLVLASKDGDLFNPLDPQSTINKRDKKRGGKLYQLRTCSQACYSSYGMFLRSKNITHYLIAQRRFRDDLR